MNKFTEGLRRGRENRVVKHYAATFRSSSASRAFLFKKSLRIGILLVMLILATGVASAHCNQTANPDTCHGCCYFNNSDGCTWCFECGDNITSVCTFDTNLTCEGDGLIAERFQTRIHGNGYRLEGNGTGTGISNAGNVILEIDDLEIKNFNRGIWLQHVSGKIYYYEIDNCDINNNSIGIDIDNLNASGFFNYCSIRNCEIQSNDKGIYVHGEDGKRIKIINNKICNNTISGIYCEDVCTDCEIDSNQVSENGEGITMNASQWTVKLNMVTNNSGSGIYVGECDNVFRSNTVSKNGGDGIHIAGASENVTLEGNTVCFNSPNDIFAVSGLSASGDNNSCANCVNYNDSRAPSGKCCVYPCVGCLGEHTGTLYRCGGVVTESCTFNGDITCPEGDGLIVGASGTAEEPIVIDGNGYCLDGVNPGTSMRTGIYNPDAHDYVTIKDLEVKNFHHGINLGGSPESPGTVEHNVIVNCSVHDNGDPNGFATHGIATYHAWNCSITNCEIYNNTGSGRGSCEDGGRGILLYGPGGHNTVTHNRVYNNGMVGIYSKMKSKYNYVAYNEVFGNGKQLPPEGTFMPGGISLACIKTDFWVVEHNNVTDNAGSGISVGGNNNVFRYNNVTNTSSATGGQGNGIYIGRCSGNHTLISNVVCDNEGEDIYVQDCCFDVTGDENTCDTSSNYNDEGTTGCTYFCGGTRVIADFSAEPTKGAAPLTVKFTDESQSAEGAIVSWKWDFGDGNMSTEQNATHTYSTAEPYSYYNVSLNVTTSEGDSDVEMKTEYIKVWKSEAAPNADFHCEPGVGDPSVPVFFTDKSIGEINTWAWDFADNNVVDNTTQNPSHQYSENGTYNVSLEVTGPSGSARETKFYCIRVGTEGVAKRPLIDAHFFASSRSGSPPLAVTFTDMSRSASEIDSWLWDFGDGNTSSEVNPTHTYNSPGIYNVSLEVTNIAGAKSREMKIGYIVVSPLFTDYFDTGKPANPYPSIFGTHKGKIIPDRDITVNRIYTYPCPGTGGHTEYVRIWNESEGVNGTGNWSGYQGDYHNITISPTITLRRGHEYNYIIITGSYPQIVHASEHIAKIGGNITCAKFTDANGKVHEGWIPAIRLWKE